MTAPLPTMPPDLRTRAVALLLMLGCVVLATVALKLSEADEDYEVVRGRVGTPVAVREGTVTVERVRVGTAIEQYGEVTPTSGMFVQVEVTAAATGRRDLALDESQLLAGKRVYAAYRGTMVGADTGFTTRTAVTFEVDPRLVEDLTLQVWDSAILVGYHQRIRIPLGFTAENAAEWRAAAEGATLGVERPTTAAIP